MTSTVGHPPRLMRELQRVAAQSERPLRRVLLGLGGLAVVAGVVLRFWAPTPLWLDEALSVDIARLPLTHVPGALAHDGSPPLYYVLLHFWMLLFGQGDGATRALSGVTSVISLPFFWLAGRRLGGRTTAWAALFLAATSPFAINYATSVRMYSQMILLALLGYLALARVIEAPSRHRVMALGALTAALLYTHYWGLYIVAVTAAWLLLQIWRAGRGETDAAELPGIRPAFGAVALGGLCWLPCAPLFVYQLLHTGTPWTGAAGPADLLRVFGDFAGGGPWGMLLTFTFFGLLVIGLFGRPARGLVSGARGGVLLTLRPRARAVPVAAVMIGTLVVAVVLGEVAHSAFVARYAAVVLPLFLLLVAMGIAVFGDVRVIAGILAVTCLAGGLTAFSENGSQRTEAGRVAAVLNVQAQPGDLIVYCPDQLGPAVSRLLHVRGVNQVTFPRATGPDRVDWVDYKKVIARADVGWFAQSLVSGLGANRNIWLVWRDGYPGLGGDCGYLRSWLDMLRPTGTTVSAGPSVPGGELLVRQDSGTYYEYENLVLYPG